MQRTDYTMIGDCRPQTLADLGPAGVRSFLEQSITDGLGMIHSFITGSLTQRGTASRQDCGGSGLHAVTTVVGTSSSCWSGALQRDLRVDPVAVRSTAATRLAARGSRPLHLLEVTGC